MSCELITLKLAVADTHAQEEDYFASITVTVTYNQTFSPPAPTLFLFFFSPSTIHKSSFQVQIKFKGEKVKKVSWLAVERGRNNQGLQVCIY